MTLTALVIAPGEQMGRFQTRRDALTDLGAETSEDWAWYVWRTTTAAWNRRRRWVLLAAEPWCTPQDWTGCINLLTLSGWFTGDRAADDIGEPMRDLARELWLWDLIRI